MIIDINTATVHDILNERFNVNPRVDSKFEDHLTKTEREIVMGLIHEVWEQIASDLMDGMDIDNISAAESILDCERLEGLVIDDRDYFKRMNRPAPARIATQLNAVLKFRQLEWSEQVRFATAYETFI